MRDFLRGSLISDTHFPHARIRTPRYAGTSLAPAPAPAGSRARFLLLLPPPPPPREPLEDVDGEEE
jgi:hypothetical protein